MQRAVVRSHGRPLRPEHLVLERPKTPVAAQTPETPETPTAENTAILPLAEFERRYLKRVLAHTRGVIHGRQGAAVLLGMKPTTLRSRLEKLGLK